jgi:hypothetical protein
MEILLCYLECNQIHLEIIRILGSIILVGLWWVPISSPLSEKFRNIYFSLFWLVICILWVIIQKDHVTSILPLLVFVFIQIIRFVFKWVYKTEPIPLLISKSLHHRYSKIENRKSNQNDFIYSLVVFLSGSFLSIVIFLD